MADDFYPFVDSGDPAPTNEHLTGQDDRKEEGQDQAEGDERAREQVSYATRIAVYDDMLSTPRVVVVSPSDVRTYLEEVTNTVYRCMREQGGTISLMVIREIVENYIHAHFKEPIVSILDDGQTIRFADQGPGISNKEQAFEFGVTTADREKKRYIRGTGAGFPMVQQYLENAGGAISIEDNLGQGTVVTVSVEPARVAEIEASASRGAAVRGASPAMAPQTAPGIEAHPAMDQSAMQPAQAPQGAIPAGTSIQPIGMAAGGAMGQVAPDGMAQQQGAAYPYQNQQVAQAPAQAAGVPVTGYQPGWVPPVAYAPAGYAPQQPVYAPYPMPAAGYPPYQTQFSTYPQQPSPAAGMMQTYVSERGSLALGYLLEHGAAGPTDLAHAFGSSAPTWSRELDALAKQGLVMKHGQKRVLTDAGAALARQQ